MTLAICLLVLNENRLPLKSRKREVVMESEEIIILDEGMDDPIGPDGWCCAGIYLPFRA